VERSRIAVLAAAAFACVTAPARAGPCTAQIAEVENYIARVMASPVSGPSGPQSVGAQLHRQPTPRSVEGAEAKARAAAEAVLDRARKADAAGDAAACAKAIEEAKQLYP